MKKFFLFTAILCSTAIAYCQLQDDSIVVAGIFRTFHFNKPAVQKQNASLVFVLHGSGGNGKGAAAGAGKMEGLAQTENFIVVYPDGYKKYWNECRKEATSAANLENIDENSFFKGMISYFEKNYNVNPKKVFVFGTSGGGHMAYKLALTMPEKIRAITAVIANLPDSSNMDCVAMGKPVPVMIINGTADPVNPYTGGEIKITGAYLGTVSSTAETFQYWADLDGYKGQQPTETHLPDTDPADGKTIVKYSYEKKGQPAVVLLKVIGGKHDYPNDINVYEEAWAFFKAAMK